MLRIFVCFWAPCKINGAGVCFLLQVEQEHDGITLSVEFIWLKLFEDILHPVFGVCHAVIFNDCQLDVCWTTSIIRFCGLVPLALYQINFAGFLLV